MFYGVIHEGYILDSKDIKYQVEEFEQGKVKTLFITGQSGSGKTTIGRKYQEQLKIPCYELDDLDFNGNFSDDNLKEYGKEMYEFFQGPGKKYRLSDSSNNLADKLMDASIDFIKFILSRNARCIVEGVEIYYAIGMKKINIDAFKNCSVIIKGTSAIKSSIRAVKRNYENDKKANPDIKLKDSTSFGEFISRIKESLKDESLLKKLREKYKKEG